MRNLGVEREVVARRLGDPGPAFAPEDVERRPGEPLLASLDALVSEIRLLGGAVEASDTARSGLGD